MKNITTRFLLISLSLFMLGIVYTGCEGKSAIDQAIGSPSGKVDDAGIHVRIDAEDGGDGTSWKKAYNDLQKAIDAVRVDSTKNKVYIAQGIYKPSSKPNNDSRFTSTDDREKHFSLANGVEVSGGYSGNGAENNPDVYKTILSGDIGNEGDNSDNVYHVFYHDNFGVNGIENLTNTAKLTGVTITKGNADGASTVHGRAGGMYNSSSSDPTLKKVIFTSNNAKEDGGAVYNYNASPVLEYVTFDDNTAKKGGGMYSYASRSSSLTNVIFTSNIAKEDGGGFYNSSTSIQLTKCTFNKNIAGSVEGSQTGRGGAIFNSSSSITGNPTYGTGDDKNQKVIEQDNNYIYEQSDLESG